MPIENTDLERRVLAHEQILQALIAQLAERQPGFLDRMLNRFASARRGAHEHDYVETADYAEAFLHEVMRLVRLREARPAISPAGAGTESPDVASSRSVGESDQSVVIRTAQVGGVWHVTRGKVFYGDYLTAVSARDAATKAAHDVTDLGGRAELIVDVSR